jgi:hypothetical protein
VVHDGDVVVIGGGDAWLRRARIKETAARV